MTAPRHADAFQVDEFLKIDKRIDQAADDAAAATRAGLRERWEFGRLLLAARVGKQLPNGLLDTLTEATGKSRAELQYRVQFAERYPTEQQVSNALDTFGSWRAIIASLGRSSSSAPPQRHKQHEEVVALSGQGKTFQQIADQTGVSARVVRRIVERERIEQGARAEVSGGNWEPPPPPPIPIHRKTGPQKSKARAEARHTLVNAAITTQAVARQLGLVDLSYLDFTAGDEELAQAPKIIAAAMKSIQQTLRGITTT